MIDISTFKFGYIIYEVDEKNNAFHKKKLKMVDADGIEWYRYDRPHYEYSIKEIIYCGKVSHIISGVVDTDNIYETEYHFRYAGSDVIFYEYENVINSMDNWFATRELAEDYIAIQSALKNA